MFEAAFFYRVVYAVLGAGLAAFVALCFIPAPYGRHGRRGWGPAIDPRIGWMTMELPAAAVVAALFLTSGRTANVAAVVFLAMWEFHYVHRALVYPLLLRPGSARMPVSIPALGIVFNLFNGYLQGGWLFRVGPPYPASWLRDPRFLSGAALFLAGMAINWHSDSVLRNLRKSGPLPDGRGSARSNRAATVRERSAAAEYKVPQGGLYRWVSCPNYLGEIVEWIGWAIATWSLAGAAFAFWTAANLIPRALSHHKWYRQQFPDYPKSRRPIIPSLYTL